MGASDCNPFLVDHILKFLVSIETQNGRYILSFSNQFEQ